MKEEGGEEGGEGGEEEREEEEEEKEEKEEEGMSNLAANQALPPVAITREKEGGW